MEGKETNCDYTDNTQTEDTGTRPQSTPTMQEAVQSMTSRRKRRRPMRWPQVIKTPVPIIPTLPIIILIMTSANCYSQAANSPATSVQQTPTRATSAPLIPSNQQNPNLNSIPNPTMQPTTLNLPSFAPPTRAPDAIRRQVSVGNGSLMTITPEATIVNFNVTVPQTTNATSIPQLISITSTTQVPAQPPTSSTSSNSPQPSTPQLIPQVTRQPTTPQPIPPSQPQVDHERLVDARDFSNLNATLTQLPGSSSNPTTPIPSMTDTTESVSATRATTPSTQTTPTAAPTTMTTVSITTPTPQQQPQSPTTPPTTQPIQVPSRPPESRRLINTPNTQSQQATGSTSTYRVLKPKARFRCTKSGDCLNGGLCNNGTCFCAPGFSGEACADDINECRQVTGEEPCFNGGKCIDQIAHYICDCPQGFRGDRCQESVDMCADNPCENGSKCVNHRTDYTCECEAGWDGKRCGHNIDECANSPCQNNATCHDLTNDYRCDCGDSGFEGKNCEVNIDDCASKPCGLGAKECVDLVGDYKCICHDGFTGKRCDKDIDECASNPCENNGTCIQKSHALQSFFGNLSAPSIEHAIYHEMNQPSETTIMAGISNMSQYAGYTCLCKEEYYGDRCEEMKKCYTKSTAELCNHREAECVNVGSSYECLISASFDGSSSAFYRVPGEFKLRDIYVKYKSFTDGLIISFEVANQLDFNVSNLFFNASGMHMSGVALQQDGPSGPFDVFFGDHVFNATLDSSLEIKSFTLARPLQETGQYAPFKGCLMQIRLNNILVPLVDYDTSGYYTTRTFEMVEAPSEVGVCRTCFDKDCQNSGHCDAGSDHCTCPATFKGNLCEIDVNECLAPRLCLNGGTCENLHGGFKCNCKEGYRGEKCQEIYDYCKAKQPCGPGTCKNVNSVQGPYQCECPSAYFGKRCEARRTCLNECHRDHAHCVNNSTCACQPGRREERIMCEYVSSCEQVEGELCLHGGSCQNLEAGGYHCHCPEPFYGPICQYILDKPQFNLILLIVVTCVGFLLAACAVVSLVVFRSVRKARATCGTYSPSTQEKHGNSASDLLKPPQPERLI